MNKLFISSSKWSYYLFSFLFFSILSVYWEVLSGNKTLILVSGCWLLQLRICSKRKLTKQNSMESNMSWSWLERWMATRVPETTSVESHAMNQYYDPSNSTHKFTIMTRFLDAAGEEKESCGSNEVPLHFDNYSINSQEEKVSFKPHTAKTNFKARRTVSRRKTVPSYQFHEEQPKVRTQNIFH